MVPKVDCPARARPATAFAAILARALERIRKRTAPANEFKELRQLLESLPRSTPEFGAAGSRLQSAGRYLRSNEWGAARWELHTLLKDLSSVSETADDRRILPSLSSPTSPRDVSLGNWLLDERGDG